MQVLLEIRIPRDMLATARWPEVEARLRTFGFSADSGFHPTPLDRMEIGEELLVDEVALGVRGSVPERLLDRLASLNWVLAIRTGSSLAPLVRTRSRWGRWGWHAHPESPAH